MASDDGGPSHLPQGRIASLDGLRAFAVGVVVLLHAGYARSVDGKVGVYVFFTLSGYLITSILLREGDAGGVRLGRFYVRRARRLLPALLLVVLAVAAYDQVLDAADRLSFAYGGLPAVLFYGANWYLLAEGADALRPFSHTWSLSVEEQFYVVWPLVLVLLTNRFRRPEWLLPVCLAGTLASFLAKVVAVGQGSSLTRLLTGTDMMADQLLVGSALAIVLSTASTDLVERLRGAASRAMPLAVAFLAYAVFGREHVKAYFLGDLRFPVEQLLIAVSTATVVAGLVLVPDGRLARVLSVRPLVWVGTISYGVYLWHVPLFLIARAEWGGYQREIGLVAVSVATLIVAGISYRFVEEPIRRGGRGATQP